MYVAGTKEMSTLNPVVARVGFTLAVLATAFVGNGIGQVSSPARDPESLVRMLGSPDWQVRSEGAARLNLIPANQLPSNYAATIISLLEQEATSPRPRMEGEGYGEYLLHVVDGVVRLRDQRSLRGLALLGIETSGAAQEYVASQGAASISVLDEAWGRSHSDGVAETWAYMLARYAQGLSRSNRLQVVAKLIGVLRENSRAFTSAAVEAPLPEVVPLVEEIATSDSVPARRQAANEALNVLRPLRDRTSPRDLLSKSSDWLDAVCAESPRADACQAIRADAANAQTQLETHGISGARPALDELARQARVVHDAGELSDLGYRLVVGNAEYLLTRSH